MTEENFIPFGKEWEKEMMQLPKKDLVQHLKKVCKENIEIQFKLQKSKNHATRT